MPDKRCKTCMHSIQNGDYYSCVERNTIVDQTYVCPEWTEKIFLTGKYSFVINHTQEGRE